jgi:hypothetical protein
MVNMISGLKSDTYEEKLREIGLESLENRRKQADLCMMHKWVHDFGDLDASEFFLALYRYRAGG